MADSLQAPSKTRETQTKLTRKKRNSRMTDAPGGEPGSVILANSFRSGRRCISESRDSATMARCPLPSPPLDIVLPPEREPWRTRATNATCCASYMRRRIQLVLPELAGPTGHPFLPCPRRSARWHARRRKEGSDMRCSMRHASSDATSASTPTSRSISSKKRCLASASSARRGDVLRK